MNQDTPGGDAGSRLEDLLRRQDQEHDHVNSNVGPVDHEPEDGGSHESESKTEPPEDKAAPVNEPPLFALLTTIENEITVERIDRIWIFPPRRIEEGETAVVVVSAFPELDPERRTVFAAHYTAPADAGEARLALQEFGTAPTDRVGRIVEDVVGRLKDEAPAAPAATRIEADPKRWLEMRGSLAEIHLDQTTRHPRLRRPGPAQPGPS